MKLALFCGEAVKAETAAASSTGRGRRLPAGASRSPAPTSAQAPAQGTAYSYCTRATLWSSERVWDTLWEPPSNAGATSPQWRGRASGRSLSAGPKFSVAPSAQRHVGMTVCKPEIYIHIYIFLLLYPDLIKILNHREFRSQPEKRPTQATQAPLTHGCRDRNSD